jgi:CHASE2 domain-containing sensor protein
VPSMSADAGAASVGGWSLLPPCTWFANGPGRPVAMLTTVVLALCHGFLGQSYWEPVRYRVFDTYQAMAPWQGQALNVVIVDIDEVWPA